jgi:hypothetical protein
MIDRIDRIYRINRIDIDGYIYIYKDRYIYIDR